MFLSPPGSYAHPLLCFLQPSPCPLLCSTIFFLLPSRPANISFPSILGFPIQHCYLSCHPSYTLFFCSYLPFSSPAGYCLFIFSCHPLTFSSGRCLLLPPDCQPSTDTLHPQVLCQAINLCTAAQSCLPDNCLLHVGEPIGRCGANHIQLRQNIPRV